MVPPDQEVCTLNKELASQLVRSLGIEKYYLLWRLVRKSACDVPSCVRFAATARQTVYCMSGMTWSCQCHHFRKT